MRKAVPLYGDRGDRLFPTPCCKGRKLQPGMLTLNVRFSMLRLLPSSRKSVDGLGINESAGETGRSAGSIERN